MWSNITKNIAKKIKILVTRYTKIGECSRNWISKPDWVKENKVVLIERKRGESWGLNTSEKKFCRQDREFVVMRNLLRVKEEMNWRASKLEKHSVVKEEVSGGGLLEK